MPFVCIHRHLTISANLDCFHFLATVNNVAMNLCVQISESLLSVVQCMYPGVGLLDQMPILYLII